MTLGLVDPLCSRSFEYCFLKNCFLKNYDINQSSLRSSTNWESIVLFVEKLYHSTSNDDTFSPLWEMRLKNCHSLTKLFLRFPLRVKLIDAIN